MMESCRLAVTFPSVMRGVHVRNVTDGSVSRGLGLLVLLNPMNVLICMSNHVFIMPFSTVLQGFVARTRFNLIMRYGLII